MMSGLSKHCGAMSVGRPARFRAPLAFALWAVAWGGFSADVEAGCGDYVTLGGTHDRDAADAHFMPFESPGPQPCCGADCQKRLPLTPPPERSAPTKSRDVACPTAADLLPSGDQRSLLAEPVQLSSEAVRTPPDRPPRSIG